MSGSRSGRGDAGRGRPGGRGRAAGRGPAPGARGGDRGGSGGRTGAPGSGGSGSRGRGAPRGVERGGGGGGAPRVRRDHGLGGDRVEGRQAVRELLLAGRRRVHEIWLAAGMDPAPILDDIVDLAAELKVPVHEIGRSKFEAEARTEAPQGVIARAAPLPEHDLDELARTGGPIAPFLVALDGVTDPGNLGALLRTAECAGVTGIVLPRHRAAHVTPTVAKAAAGAIEFLPMALVGGLPAAISRLRDLGVWVIGLDEAGDTTLAALDLTQPVCLVLGAEATGLSRLVRQRCDAVAGIPLRGRLNSLNVSAAGAVACFEVTRQRG